MRVFIGALNLTLAALLVFIAIYANAQADNTCTPWVVKNPGTYCVLTGGVEGLYYVRDCANVERICKWKPSGPMQDCEKVQLCTQDDPNQLVDCGPWRRVNGVTCMDRQTREWGPKWTRSCVLGGMVEEHCSPRTPPPGALL